MTIVSEFAESLGLEIHHVSNARMRLKEEGSWPGEDLKGPMTYRRLGKEVTREVISLSLEQQEAIVGKLIRTVESGRTGSPEVIEFVRTYKEQAIEGGVPAGARLSKGPERM